MKSESVKLIENFVSWQGEGPDSGRTMIILRFKTCNLNCPWCDTSVKMRISAEAPYLLKDIQKTINEKKAGLLITGGEPTVPKHFDECVSLLNDLVYPIANVESNGFQLLKLIESVDKKNDVNFIYSPKIFNAEDAKKAMDLTQKLFPYKNVHIKVVFQNTPLIHAYLKYVTLKLPALAWNHRLWLMPEGTNRVDLIKNASGVFDACEDYGANFSSRDHIIYGFV